MGKALRESPKELPANRVQILDSTVVDQIAAGEVVERPASVVKELVENALDAAASEITVVIVAGGKMSIEVIDNGHGMTREDALVAVQRFGTSKIQSTSDLLNLASLGFRGEALPSIASISQFRLSSCTQNSAVGVELEIAGGELQKVKDAKHPVGTRVSVQHLFYNVPARRRFLKTDRTEIGSIRAVLGDIAVAVPHVRIRLVSDGAELAAYPTASSFFERAKSVALFSGTAIEVNKHISGTLGDVSVVAYLSEPLQAVAHPGKLRLIINGRVVRDRLLLKATREGFGNFLKPGRYPAGCLSLQVPPLEVDVNVHPQKSEVRFRNPQLVFQTVRTAVAEACQGRGPQVLTAEAQYQNIPNSLEFRQSFAGYASSKTTPADVAPQISFFEQASSAADVSSIDAAEGKSPRREALSTCRYLGQVFHCYLLFEGTSSLYLLDMHAAHERVTHNRLWQQFRDGTVSKQQLLLAEIIPVPPEWLERAEDVRKILTQVGFDCDLLDDESFIVRAVPSVLSGVSVQALVNDIFAAPLWMNIESAMQNRVDAVIARLACHGSIRKGRELEKDEVFALVESLEEAENSAYCPHGRPVVCSLSTSELEFMFGRVQ